MTSKAMGGRYVETHVRRARLFQNSIEDLAHVHPEAFPRYAELHRTTPIEAIQKFLAVWERRSKYHFGDRELVAAVRVLRYHIEDKPATWAR